MTDQPSLLFIFGVGYSAHFLAKQRVVEGWRVAGTVRTAEKAQRLAADGIAAEVWTGEGALNVPDEAHWLITLPPDADGCPGCADSGTTCGSKSQIRDLSFDNRGVWRSSGWMGVRVERRQSSGQAGCGAGES